MIDTLMEQVVKTVNAAVEERAQLYGPYYASALEGYGDIHRQMVGVNASMKTLRKEVDELVVTVNMQDPQEAMRRLDLLDSKAKMLAYEVLRMCETVVRYKNTVKNAAGGDLLDILNDAETEEE